MLQQGLLDLKPILVGLKGRTVVFVVSDGSYTVSSIESSDPLDVKVMKKPVEIARDIALTHNVSFIMISNAPGETDEALLKAVGSVNESSRVIPLDQFIKNPTYTSGALFVLQERLVQNVINREKVVGAQLRDILFDFDRSDISPEFHQGLGALAKFLGDNPQTYVVFAGFTDGTGSQEYNFGLSRRRAEVVRAYVVEKLNVIRNVLHCSGTAVRAPWPTTLRTKAELKTGES